MSIVDAEQIKTFGDKILVIDMEFGDVITKGGIILSDDDGTSRGIHPRWSKVFQVGSAQKDIAPGEYILVKHGRWTRGFEIMLDGKKTKLFMVENKSILLKSKTKPLELDMVGK